SVASETNRLPQTASSSSSLVTTRSRCATNIATTSKTCGSTRTGPSAARISIRSLSTQRSPKTYLTVKVWRPLGRWGDRAAARAGQASGQVAGVVPDPVEEGGVAPALQRQAQRVQPGYGGDSPAVRDLPVRAQHRHPQPRIPPPVAGGPDDAGDAGGGEVQLPRGDRRPHRWDRLGRRRGI